MNIIKLLPENLINQIAAGEVVERPASVVKELVENSIDAGASRIVVEISQAGRDLIKITDNGRGIPAEDLGMALQRHATSKIFEESDLWKILSMGFRGEALASISSVSQLTIRSKQVDETAGREINCDGGNIMNSQDVALSTGTQVEVRDLFFNTPARQKYLKKESTELSYISTTLNNIALAKPEIAFKLIHNDKVVFDLAPSENLLSRISEIFGNATGDAMLPIFYGGSDFKMNGYIGKPAISRANSKYQLFFVNERPIHHALLANIITNAYHSMLMENKKPVFFINIEIDPAMIDVNVHPRKMEIRFQDQAQMIKVLYSATKKALESTNLMPKGFSESRRYMSDSFPKERSGFSGPSSFTPGEAMDFSKNIMKKREQNSLKIEEDSFESTLTAISQVANSYIVAQSDDGLVLIDQHAGHERVRYEQLMDQFENQEKKIQPLLIPLSIEFAHDEVALIEENKNIFEELGFEIEPFGGKTFNILAVPRFFSQEDIDQVFHGVLDDLMNNKSPGNFQGRIEEIITYISCRSAIKFGQKLGLEEMQSLILQMEKLKRPYTCPHGRPTMVSLTLSELEKMFGRK